MRQSELSARLSRLLSSLFRDAHQVLSVGGPLTLPGRTVTALGEPAETLTSSQRYEAALWRLSSDTRGVRAGLSILRSALVPGASLVLAAPRRAPALTQLKSVLAGESAPRASLEPLCNALLLTGFLGPRVFETLPGFLLVSAQLAARPDPLDAFFEQPVATQNR